MRNLKVLSLALLVVANAAIKPALADDSSLRRDYARAMIAKGQTVKAAQQLSIIVASGTAGAQDYALLGDALRYCADFKNALPAYTTALRISPLNSQALAGLALTYAQSGQYGRALSIVRSGLSQTSNPEERKYLASTLASIQNMSTIAHAPAAGSVAQ